MAMGWAISAVCQGRNASADFHSGTETECKQGSALPPCATPIEPQWGKRWAAGWMPVVEVMCGVARGCPVGKGLSDHKLAPRMWIQ